MHIAVAREDRIFQALADPSRRAIFESLMRGEAAVKDLTARFDISQPAISQHLATLKDAGLLNGRRLFSGYPPVGPQRPLELGGRQLERQLEQAFLVSQFSSVTTLTLAD